MKKKITIVVLAVIVALTSVLLAENKAPPPVEAGGGPQVGQIPYLATYVDNWTGNRWWTPQWVTAWVYPNGQVSEVSQGPPAQTRVAGFGQSLNFGVNEAVLLRNGAVAYIDHGGGIVQIIGTNCYLWRAEMAGFTSGQAIVNPTGEQRDETPVPFCYVASPTSPPPPPPPPSNTSECPAFAGYQSWSIGTNMCKLYLTFLVSGYTPSGWTTDYWDGHTAHYGIPGGTWIRGSEFTFKR